MNFSLLKVLQSFKQNVPILWLRFIPALCGSLLAPCVYKLLLQTKLSKLTSTIGGILIIFGNFSKCN